MMLPALAVIAAILGAGVAKVEAPPPVRWWVQEPPSRFQTDTSGSIRFIPQAKVEADCFGQGTPTPPPGFHTMACAGHGVMTLPNPCEMAATGDAYAQLLCHEMAHLNGWPSDHPKD